MNVHNVFENIELLDYLTSPINYTDTCLHKDLLFLKKFTRKIFHYNQFHSHKKHVKTNQNRCSLVNLNRFNQVNRKHSKQTVTLYNNNSPFGKSVLKVFIIPKIPLKLKSKVHKPTNYNNILAPDSNNDNLFKIVNLQSTEEKGRHYISTYEDQCVETNLINMQKARNKDIGIRRIKLKDRNDACECKLDGVNPHKSRVTIVGQLGLTQDDRYVLNCSATVNDEPSKYLNLKIVVISLNIPTHGMPKRGSASGLVIKQNKNIPSRDLNYKVNGFTNGYESLHKRMATQSTQINFNSTNNKLKKEHKDQTIQCNCNETEIVFNGSESNVLKKCKSPLLVISIYPKDNDVENTEDNSIQIIHKISPNHSVLRANKQKIKKDQMPVRNRSPNSPTTDNSKIYFDKTRVTKTTNYFSRKESPQRIKNYKKPGVKLNDVKYTKKTETEGHHNYSFDRNKERTEQVKKALVDNFVNKIDRISRNVPKTSLITPKDEASKITVNIDGANENYDVMFEKSKFDTGLVVRKSDKAKYKYKSQENADENLNENFLMFPDDLMEASQSGQQDRNTKILPSGRQPTSRIKVRDSLEIRHRKGRQDVSKANDNKIKKINNNDFEQRPNKSFNSKTSKVKSVKHFRGDDCSILDPNERDKEVRQLLGTFRRSEKRMAQDNSTANIYADVRNRSCLRQCSKCIMTGLSLTKLLLSKNTEKKDNSEPLLMLSSKLGLFSSKNEKLEANNDCTSYQSTTLNVSNRDPDKPQNTILNRNVQVFLQVEQFNNTRPVILTRKQYNRVKKSIQKNNSKKVSLERSKKSIKNYDEIVSVGEVKVKTILHQPAKLECEVQTERTEIKKLRKRLKKSKDNQLISCQEAAQNMKIYRENKSDIKEKHFIEDNVVRQAVSSMEIQCTSVDYMKRVIISATHVENLRNSFHSGDTQRDNSIHTIFKGHRKCTTPNLGTSAYSLDSCRTASSNDFTKPYEVGDCKAKKPFLRRLISCLVMRAHTSECKADATPLRKLTRNSSVDSYQINTSLGGLEMSSSLYDTSVSFYSNHKALPVNKIKRGFLSSVRGFLTNRRT